MFGKQSFGSLLPALVMTVGLTAGLAGISSAASQAQYEFDIKQADAKVNNLTYAVSATKRQMETANLISKFAKSSKNMPAELVGKIVAEAQYRKEFYTLMNLDLQAAKMDKAKAEADLQAFKAKAAAEAAAAEKKNADAKVETAKKTYDAAADKAKSAVAKAKAAKKDPKVAAAAENTAAEKAKTEYDTAMSAKKAADAKYKTMAGNAAKAEAAATKAKNPALSAASSVKSQKYRVDQAQIFAKGTVATWDAQKKRMDNNPFLRAVDNVDRAITDTIEKAKDDPVAAAAAVVKTAIGGVDNLVTGAISAAANSPWFKGTKVGTAADIIAYFKDLPGKPKDTAVDQVANLVSSIYKAKTVKEAFNLFTKAENQRKTETFTEILDKTFDLIKAYDKDFDDSNYSKYRKAIIDVFEQVPPPGL